jgi:hypothetical protein
MTGGFHNTKSASNESAGRLTIRTCSGGSGNRAALLTPRAPAVPVEIRESGREHFAPESGHDEDQP